MHNVPTCWHDYIFSYMLLPVGGHSAEAIPSTAPDYIPEGPPGPKQACEAQGG